MPVPTIFYGTPCDVAAACLHTLRLYRNSPQTPTLFDGTPCDEATAGLHTLRCSVLKTRTRFAERCKLHPPVEAAFRAGVKAVFDATLECVRMLFEEQRLSGGPLDPVRVVVLVQTFNRHMLPFDLAAASFPCSEPIKDDTLEAELEELHALLNAEAPPAKHHRHGAS
jgi:hypothetical protein